MVDRAAEGMIATSRERSNRRGPARRQRFAPLLASLGGNR